MAKKPEVRDVYRAPKSGQFVERRPSGRILAETGRQMREGADTVHRVPSSSGRIRRVQDAFKRARKGEGLFGLKNAK
jgi:hypothetical protein